MQKKKKLYRSQKEKMLGGVCGGIAQYFGIDPTLIRLIFVIIFFAEGAGFLAYVVAWIIIPEEPEEVSPKNSIQNKENQSEAHTQEGDIKAKERDREPEYNRDDRREKSSFSKREYSSQNIWGIILIIIGGIFLINTWMSFLFLDKVWPLLLVLLGAALLIKSSNKKQT